MKPGDQISIDRPGKSPTEPTQGPNMENTLRSRPRSGPQEYPDFIEKCANQELWCPELKQEDQINIDRTGKSPAEPTQGPNMEKTVRSRPRSGPKEYP